MAKTFKAKPTAWTADQVGEMATRGEDVSTYLTNKFTVVRPVRRVNVDLTQGMLRELDARAARLNISRVQALAVHAKDDEARRFYQHFDFVRSPSDPMHLFVLLKDVRRIVAGE
jgi:hypothetical protein